MTSDKTTAVRSTACNSCGATVAIYSRASFQVVCPYCRSTLVRNDLQWDAIGKMALVADDLSPLHIGLRGKYDTTAFSVIGRVQQQYGEGIWNEWLLQLDNHRTCWLSEGSGLYYLTLPSTSAELLPSFSSLNLGQLVTLDGKRYSVSNIEQARCIACEGEIPFAAEPGETANLVDLVGDDNSFACLDYSDSTIKLYTGKVLNAEQLDLGSNAAKPIKQQTSIELRCAGCGNAIAKINPASKLFACSSCKLVNKLSPAGALIHGYRQAHSSINPDIAPGSRGMLEGVNYEVLGFMRRYASGDSWDEYMLYNPSQGIRWLICSSGHWTLMQSCAAAFGALPYHQGRRYREFSGYTATVNHVLGEFYWQVKSGEQSDCTDYIAPPFIMCREKTHKEVTWSHGYYIPHHEIAEAFNIELSRPSGVGTNQPSPELASYLIAYLASFLLGVIITVVMHTSHSKNIGVGTMKLSPSATSASLVSEPFTLEDPHALFRVKTATNLDNNWAAFDYSLTNQDTGETRAMTRELAYYSGRDSDGSWSEGNRSDSAILDQVVAGRYVLEVDGEMPSTGTGDVYVSIVADHASSYGSNLWLLLVVLGIGPLLALIRKYFFEKKRWSQSDHAWDEE